MENVNYNHDDLYLISQLGRNYKPGHSDILLHAMRLRKRDDRRSEDMSETIASLMACV